MFEGRAPAVAGLRVRIVYDCYDGLPLLGKHLSIENSGAKTIVLNRVVSESLALVEEESAVK